MIDEKCFTLGSWPLGNLAKPDRIARQRNSRCRSGRYYSVNSSGVLFRLTPVRHSPIPPFFVGATKYRGGGRRQWRNVFEPGPTSAGIADAGIVEPIRQRVELT